ncbi:unnamed protein product [Calicophoron daubneyi]|uniref:Drosha n=1 Tax=Calicophoron daubneyi TaxID=300641 RepID=A0AAV2TJZ2_CALDB
MSKLSLPSDKKVIYITPEELSKLPGDSPVYVLQTDKADSTSQASVPAPSVPTSSVGSVSTLGSPSPQCYAGTLSSSRLIGLYPSLSSVYHQGAFSPSTTVPYPYNTLPPVPIFMPTQPANPFTPYFMPGMRPQYPTSYTYMPGVPTNGHMTQWPAVNIASTVPSSSAHPGTQAQPVTVPQYDPSQPPPKVLRSECSRNSRDKSPFAKAQKSMPFSKSNKEQEFSGRKSEPKSPPSSEKKPAEAVRYAKVICAPAPGFFILNPTTGCQHATQPMIELEDRFSNEVLGRRPRAIASQPPRKPLDRRVFNDIVKQQSESPPDSGNIADAHLQGIIKDGSNKCDDAASRLEEGTTDTNNTSLMTKTNAPAGSLKPLETKKSCMEDVNSETFPKSKEASCLIKPLFCTNSHETNATAGDGKAVRPRPRKRKSHHFRKPDPKPGDSNSLSSHDSRSIGGHSIAQRSIRQQREVAYKLSHPNRMHPDIWHNEENEFNDGPACSCRKKYQIGPLHNQYEGEELVPLCEPESNNRDRLHHYRIMISPTTNFTQPKSTKIKHNGYDYIFDGFSLFVHYELDNPPPCQILRFNLLYDIFPVEEDFPEFFTIRSLDLVTQYIFTELLELMDLSWRPHGVTEGCPVVHLMPRFVRILHTATRKDGSAGSASTVAEILPMSVVLQYLLQQALTPVMDVMELSYIQRYNTTEWSNYIADLRGTLATFPGKKPAAIRIDQLDRRSLVGEPSEDVLIYPLIVHMTYTPMKLSLTREPKYKCVLKNFMKLQYLMMNKPRISPADRAQLVQLASELESMEQCGVHRREITVELSSEGFYRTGIRPDVSQHAINLVSLISHIRFHKSLESLENRLGYKFKDKSLLHQALTHPSYRRTNFGTNQDHFQNSLVSCGPRIIEYGDKLQLYKAWRKKGLTKMIQVMSVLPKMHEERSNIYGNERLEFLGDAVIEVISSIHLYFMFPDQPEGHLDAYRQAIVQNQHLAELAVRLGIHKFLLYTHSVDFCYDSTFIYARSDAFEALMAAIALDAGLDTVDRIFGAVLFGDEPRIHRVWVTIPPHPLQAQYPNGDRTWVTKVPMLRKLPILEEVLGIKFKHLRVLARAMTVRKTGFNFYTFGDNQRLEFLGDSLLKYVSTDYLFRHFPRHHEGHLSLLKNSLVNRYTQAAVCTELGLDQFVIRREDNSVSTTTESSCNNGSTKLPAETKLSKPTSLQAAINAQNQNVKYRADLLEAFIGALFVDKDLIWVERFCQVCFWPRLVEFILKQEWNDAKSKLQQCCLTFRSLHEDPEIAHYKLLDHSGPTNQRTYLVGVYFRGQRLATGTGRSVQQAQMDAAKNALEIHQDTFRQLDFQRSVISRRYKQPYIEKMLDHVHKWDEKLVDYFVADANSTCTGTYEADNNTASTGQKSPKSEKLGTEVLSTSEAESSNAPPASTCSNDNRCEQDGPSSPGVSLGIERQADELPRTPQEEEEDPVLVFRKNNGPKLATGEEEEGEIIDDDDEWEEEGEEASNDDDCPEEERPSTSAYSIRSSHRFDVKRPSRKISDRSRSPFVPSGTLADLIKQHRRSK